MFSSFKKLVTKQSSKPRFSAPTFQIKRLISIAFDYKASDIHFEPKSDGLKVRFRIDGILRDIQTLPLEISRPIIVALKVMSNIDIAESRKPQDGRIGEEYYNSNSYKAGLLKKIDMRVSTLPCLGGEKAVIRLLPKDNPFSKLEFLGFSENALARYKNWISQTQGLIILTGPTGSGKTSTLNTTLRRDVQLSTEE
ncbi:MAG: Flp pilus assembly complex ATPase component TadA [Hormoscilla sp. GUM202]|nr:Flp pilus assembly complex ATPase component TadA [Hormoscilla sp. GUM202]